MPTLIPVGPYQTREAVEGVPFPYYIIPFDEDGVCVGPLTLAHLLENCSGYSDIFVFSHGWNNDWSTATKRYEDFIEGFQQQRKSLKLKMPEGYRPLLVGIFWPSQALEWFESERGPKIAGGETNPSSADVQSSKQLLDGISSQLNASQRPRFFELAQRDVLSQTEAIEFSQMLAALTSADDEGIELAAPRAEDLLAAAASLTQADSEEPDYDQVGTVGGASADIQAALSLGDIASALDPRSILKPFTVWQMKDRAGKIGGAGVTAMIQGLLSQSSARLHVVGHSYGCKVVMTAVSKLVQGTRPLRSAVLFEPAVSQYAFASKIPGRPDMRGGFFGALQRVTNPIVCTYSDNDVPLTKMFHLALRRRDDLGEGPVMAGGPPSKFAALGGFGPQETDGTSIPIQDEGQPYVFGGGGRLVAVNGTRTIGGHGDISNQSTWWLFYSAITA